MSLPSNPITRKETYLAKIAGQNVTIPDEPITREEMYLDAIAKGGGSGDGDMKKSVYDSDLDVATAGGIKAFVSGAMADKADKPTSPTNGNLASLDSNGDLADSGISKDVVPSGTTTSNKLVNASDVASRVDWSDAEGYVGKNKAVNNMKTHSVAGLSLTVNNDKSISLNGTSTDGIANTINGGLIWDGVDTLPYGRYKLLGCPSGGSNSTYRLLITNTAESAWVSDLGEGAEFTVDSTTTWKQLYIRVNANVDMTGKVYKPMIIPLGAPEEPYEPRLIPNTDLVSYDFNAKTGVHQLLKYPYRNTTKTDRGITFTDNGDGTITVSGTNDNTDNSFFYIDTNSTPGSYDYIKSLGRVTLTGGISSNVELYVAKYNGTDTLVDTGNGVTFAYTNPTASDYQIVLFVRKGTSLSEPVTIKPLLRYAEDTNTTFTPFAMTNLELTDAVQGKLDVNNPTLVTFAGLKNKIPNAFDIYDGFVSNDVMSALTNNVINVVGKINAYHLKTSGNANYIDWFAMTGADTFAIGRYDMDNDAYISHKVLTS